MMHEQDVTAVISPCWPHCAPRLQDAEGMNFMNKYSSIWTMTGFPVGIMPITTVASSEQQFNDSYQDEYTKMMKSNCVGSENLPISVQVIGRPFHDEQVLGLMKSMQSEIGYEISIPEVDLRDPEYQPRSNIIRGKGKLPSMLGGVNMSSVEAGVTSHVDASFKTKELS